MTLRSVVVMVLSGSWSGDAPGVPPRRIALLVDGVRSRDDPWHGAAAWLQRRVPHLLAVIGHGAAATDERIPGAPLEVLAVVRLLPLPARRSALQSAFAGRLPG